MSDLQDVIADVVIRETVGEIQNEQHVRDVYARAAGAIISAIGESGRIIIDRARFEQLLEIEHGSLEAKNEQWLVDNAVAITSSDLKPL